MGTSKQVAENDLQESFLKNNEQYFLPQKETLQQQQEQQLRDERDASLLRMERVSSAPESSQIDDLEGVQFEEINDDKKQQYTRGSSVRGGKEFKSAASSNRRQFRSILKSSKAFGNDSLLVQPRLDASGNVIKSFANSGEKPLHKITFHENITEVNVVENWKKYNTDTSQEPSCGCVLI